MDEVLKDYIREFIEVYIDDIMIYSKNFKDHICHMEKVFKKLREYNLIIKLKKYKFGERNIEFLGHEIGKDGLKPNKKKVEAIKKIKESKQLLK